MANIVGTVLAGIAGLLLGFMLLPYFADYATWVWSACGAELLRTSGIDISECTNIRMVPPAFGVGTIASSFPADLVTDPIVYSCANCYLVWCERNGKTMLYKCVVYGENGEAKIECEKEGETDAD